MEWADEGDLRLSPGKTIDPSVVATLIGELSGATASRASLTIAGHGNVRREFDRIGLQTYEDDEKRGSGLRLVAFGQGYEEMGRRSTPSSAPSSTASSSTPDNPALNF